jgi:hypothetical protein
MPTDAPPTHQQLLAHLRRTGALPAPRRDPPRRTPVTLAQLAAMTPEQRADADVMAAHGLVRQFCDSVPAEGDRPAFVGLPEQILAAVTEGVEFEGVFRRPAVEDIVVRVMTPNDLLCPPELAAKWRARGIDAQPLPLRDRLTLAEEYEAFAAGHPRQPRLAEGATEHPWRILAQKLRAGPRPGHFFVVASDFWLLPEQRFDAAEIRAGAAEVIRRREERERLAREAAEAAAKEEAERPAREAAERAAAAEREAAHARAALAAERAAARAKRKANAKKKAVRAGAKRARKVQRTRR